MELLKSCLIDWILFSSIEGVLYCLCFHKVFNCSKFKLYEILIISIVNCIISTTIPTLLYQVVMVFWMGAFLCLKERKPIKDCMKYSFLTMIGQLITEMLFAMFYEYALGIDLFRVDKLNLFAIMLPIRVVQTILILLLAQEDKRKEMHK